MNKLASIIIFIALVCMAQAPAFGAPASSDMAIFDPLFVDWTKSFNKKDLAGTYKLFSTDCVSSNPGAPHKDYATICKGFQKIFSLPGESYQYKYKIQNIYRSGDLATVRITWYLNILKNGKVISRAEEQGIDIFKRNEKGEWKIVNWLAYSEKK